MRVVFILALFGLGFVRVFAQQNPFHRISPRAAGMAYVVANLDDISAVFNNPAGLHALESKQLFFHYESRFNLPELNTVSAAFSSQFLGGCVGIGLARFGGELMNVQRASLAFSDRFGITSLGLRINYDQFQVEGFGRKALPSFDFGGKAELGPNLSFGAFATNLSQASIIADSEALLPMIMVAGFRYQADEGLWLQAEIEKDLDFPANPRFGLEYELGDNIILRSGYQLRPASPHFGLAFRHGNWQIDLASYRHRYLGFAHQFSFSYQIHPPKKP